MSLPFNAGNTFRNGGTTSEQLVGLFAQDRLLYMLSVSVVVSFIFYFRNAYQKDPTLLMLTGVMTLMMSNGGDAEGAFQSAVHIGSNKFDANL